MNPVIRNILAVLAGLVVGSVVNMGLILISGYVIPPPEGADITTTEGLKKSIHLFEPRHFVFPFLAHALGTLVGAFVAAKLAVNNKMRIAIIVSLIFLCGGIANVMMLPAPAWFSVVDLAVAYLPMGWLAAKLAERKAVLSN